MPGTEPGPVSGSRFVVEIGGSAGVAFSRVELPQAVVAEVTYRSGNGIASGTRMVPGASHYTHLVLSRALTSDLTLWTWWKQARDADPGVHREVVVRLFDDAGSPVMAWRFRGAFPAVHRVSPLDTATQARLTEPVTETVELAFDSVDAET